MTLSTYTRETRRLDYARLDLISDVSGEHVAVDCCSREGDLTSPSKHESVTRVYGLEGNISNHNRQRYAFYLSYHMVEEMVRGGAKLSITCPCCRNSYELDEKILELLLDEEIPKEQRIIKKVA
ncbi:MAG: hypothetical protein AABW64_02690 [Nanoarchaeota archaeon]